MKLTIYYSPGFAAPLGEHRMPIRKFGLVAEELASWPDISLVEPAAASLAAIEQVHTKRYIEAIRTGEPRWLAEMQKFPWSQELFASVCLTNGGCLAAARQALKDGASAALASGFHHACADHGEGYCTFHGLMVAADALLATGEARKVAVLDLDLHYGNGTAQLAVSRPHVEAFSVYGNDYWNNIAYRDVAVRRHEDGPNHRSWAIPAKADGAMLEGILDRVLPEVAAVRPDVLLYQAGADPYFEDPYSPLALDHEDLRARDLKVLRFARVHGIPIAWVLAGGYTEDVSKVVQVHVNTFHAWREAYA
jgi:acetoin utilization deacetylase AcuC-like enzyme